MAQVSRRKLDKDLEQALFDQLWNFLAKIDNPNKAASLYSDLLTETEKLILAKRLATALLILRKRTTQEIKSKIAVSTSTVSNVSQWLKYCRPETRRMLENLSKQKDFDAILDKIDGIIDKLPPRYYSDWKQAGKEKYQRIKQRSAKAEIR